MKYCVRLAVLYYVCIALTLHAQLRLPAVFGDHMVLQQNSNVAIWGWTSSSGEVRLVASWDGAEKTVKALSSGAWRTTITTPSAGGPYTIQLSGAGEVVIQDVMIGEVWICSGQSNMEWSMNAAIDGREALPQAANSNIRLFRPARSAAPAPQIRGEGSWSVCSPQSAGGFSAVGYFFGKRIQDELGVPIGLLDISWGGTPAEVWVPDSVIRAHDDLLAAAMKLKEVPWCPVKPGVVFNAMIYPIVPFAIAGVIWYQGEGNTGIPLTYRQTMEQLIGSWRRAFKKDFPFYYVQIAPYDYGSIETGSLIREQQVRMLEIRRTGMVVVSDHVENVKDIHPKYKQPVGERLANYALGDTYGVSGLNYLPPLYKSMTVEKGKVRVGFQNAPAGLVARGGDPTEFMIAGEDRQFVPAKAKINGSSVVVWSAEVKKPVAVRFGWPNASIPNLFSREGLPVSCFRTDDWPILKQ